MTAHTIIAALVLLLSHACAAQVYPTDSGVVPMVGFGVPKLRKCHQLRRPPRNVGHELVHVHLLDDIDAKAYAVCAHRRVMPYRCGSVVRELHDTAQEMAMLNVADALVNVTLDYSLEFTLVQQVSTDIARASSVDGATSPSDTSTTASQPTERVVGTLHVFPQQQLEDTVIAYCRINSAIELNCEELYTEIEALVMSYWGCASDDDDDDSEDNAAPATLAALPVHVPLVLMQMQAPVNHLTHKSLQQQQTPDDARVTISSHFDSTEARIADLVLDTATNVDLQVALFCRKHTVQLTLCETLLWRAHNATRTTPAFQRERERRQALNKRQLSVTSPVPRGLYVQPRRLYLEIGEPLLNASSDPLICLFIDYRDEPAMCSPELWDEPKYINKYTLALGHHILMFAALPRSSADGATAIVTASSVNDSDWLVAVPYDVVEPRIEVVHIDLETVAASATDSASHRSVHLIVTVQTAHFDLFDARHKLCTLHNDIFACLAPHAVTIVRDAHTVAAQNRSMVLQVPLFNVSAGMHDVTVLLLNEYRTAVAVTTPLGVNVDLDDDAVPFVQYNASTFTPPQTRGVDPRPRRCPVALRTDPQLGWICDLWCHEWGQFSQNGEDGVLRSIFHHIGVHHREYVEFGTEDARECNTRLWRESFGWTGLLMDGGFANPSINLHRAFVTAENVNALFATHNVSRRFDLLSIDVDFNDYWILDALDLAQFAPRVVVCEYNSHVPPGEARAVRYDAARGWDNYSDYFGVSARALAQWGMRHNYSLVYCESHGVNCFLIHNDALGANVSALLDVNDVYVPPNFFGRGFSYPNASRVNDEWIWVA